MAMNMATALWMDDAPDASGSQLALDSGKECSNGKDELVLKGRSAQPGETQGYPREWAENRQLGESSPVTALACSGKREVVFFIA